MCQQTESFIRWQKLSIEQLSYVLNLVFTLAIAAIGYCFALLRDDGFKPGPTARSAFLLALLFLVLSAIFGIVCIIIRLSDFRCTAQRAKLNPNAPTRDELRGLGKKTWGFFYAQITAFAFGVFALMVVLFLTYGGKLT